MSVFADGRAKLFQTACAGFAHDFGETRSVRTADPTDRGLIVGSAVRTKRRWPKL